MTVWVWGRPSVVVVVAPGAGVVVVVASAQLPAAQLSQQLGTVPTNAAPPLGSVHFAALGFTEHVWLPMAVVRKHVTDPALPQIDFLAHPTTDALHCFGRLPLCAAVLATWATHRM
jgi:hypothetical protein